MASNDEKLTEWLKRATALEMAAETQARVEKIEDRERVYHLDWRQFREYNPEDPIEMLKDIMPQVVADRAIDKLKGQLYTVTCRSAAPEVIPPEPLEMLMQPGVDLAAQQDPELMLSNARKQAKKLAETKEAAVKGLFEKIEKQQGLNIRQAVTRNAVVPAYAGPVRVGYEPLAAQEPGVVAIYMQILDPRCYFEVPDKVGPGPRLVIYKRQASRQALLEEGWDVLEDKFVDLDPGSQITIYDCWEKVRTKKGLQLWHCIIATGGGFNQEFLKPPTDMAKRGFTRIPYAWRPVRPKGWVHEDYLEGEATGFIDVLCTNFEARCRMLSRQAQLVALAADPVKVAKVTGEIEADATTPGNTIQIMPNEDVEVLGIQANPTIAQAWGMVEQQTQRGTFASASYGEGIHQMSGTMTGRLQQAGEEALDSTRLAIEDCLSDVMVILAMFASIYIEGDVVVPNARERAMRVDGGMFSASDVFDVDIPALSLPEMLQLLAGLKQLAEPRGDGSKWVSDQTTREFSKVLQYSAQEDERVQEETYAAAQFQTALKRMEKDAARVEMMEDTVAQMQAQMSAMQQATAYGVGPPQGPGGDAQNPPGVGRTPIAGPAQQGMPVSHEPEQRPRGM